MKPISVDWSLSGTRVVAALVLAGGAWRCLDVVGEPAPFPYVWRDVAVVHPDGYVEIRDRSKDVIISGGENISSVEIEGVLLSHPAVFEAAVVGVPDEKWGETPHAFVVLKPGAEATAEVLREFLRERLAHFKTPRGFTFIPELPKTATGKIQKYMLRGKRAAISAQ